MITILKFNFEALGSATRSQAEVRPSAGLFRMGEAPGLEGESTRWGGALLFTALLHAGLLLVGLSLPGPLVKEAPPPEEPELVFFSVPPPSAAASSTTASRPVVAGRVQRPTRLRLPRPLAENHAPTPVPTEASLEQTLSASDEVGTATGGSGGVGGIVAGLVAGILDGREGGLVGATGGTALDLKQVARAPRVLEQVRPQYPRQAKAERLEGLVVVRVIIGTDGHIEPEHTRVIRSIPGLDAAAISVVRQWRFSPALGQQGRPVRVIVEIPIQFSLK